MIKIIRILTSHSFIFRSWLYNFLIGTKGKLLSTQLKKKIWEGVIVANSDKPVKTTIHGFKVTVNSGFMYPLIAREYPTFNNPYLQLVYQVSENKKESVVVYDIGAAVGDSAFFLLANLNKTIREIVCIDGDAEFYKYLISNTKKIPFVKPFYTILAEENKKINAIERIHSGSSSAVGNIEVQAVSLDNFFYEKKLSPPDVIKIDTDGYDGNILLGARHILSIYKPAVIFEWHPENIQKTGNDYFTPFKCLNNNGYNNFIFFDKYGVFFKHIIGFKFDDINELLQNALQEKYDKDWHCDVIALHSNGLNISQLTVCEFAKNKKSFY